MYSRFLSAAFLLSALIAQTTCAPADEITKRDDTSAIIGTWSDAHCSTGKQDKSAGMTYPNHYSKCQELLENSMELFWLKKACPGKYSPRDSLVKNTHKEVGAGNQYSCADWPQFSYSTTATARPIPFLLAAISTSVLIQLDICPGCRIAHKMALSTDRRGGLIVVNSRKMLGSTYL